MIPGIQGSLAVQLLGCIQSIQPSQSIPHILITPAASTGGDEARNGSVDLPPPVESKGKHMIAIAIGALIVFVAGIAAGIMFVVTAGVRREERDLARRREEADFSLALQAPDRVTQGARRVAGLHVLDMAGGPEPTRA
jgi:hypothetical protein